MLDRVTITGADMSVKPEELANLSLEYPWVEWGILVSKSNSGKVCRYPPLSWIVRLQANAMDIPVMKLSLHVCGRWVRDMLIGRYVIPASELYRFSRVQLNFHAEQTRCDRYAFHDCMMTPYYGGIQFIFQIDGVNGNKHLNSLLEVNDGPSGIIDTVTLFDISGGAGILPDEWPKPIMMVNDSQYAYHGYAGGLGPDNIAEQIPLILKAAGTAPIWIDMETHIRSDDGSQFDLDKVRRCLEIAKPFIGI